MSCGSRPKRANNKGKRELRCLVEGCGVTFTQNTARAVRFCPEHRLAATIMVENEVSRFCSQCSRAHPLPRFEGDSRSCGHRVGRKRQYRINNRLGRTSSGSGKRPKTEDNKDRCSPDPETFQGSDEMHLDSFLGPEESNRPSESPNELAQLDAWWGQLADSYGAAEEWQHVLSTWSGRSGDVQPFYFHGIDIQSNAQEVQPTSWGFNAAMKFQGATPAGLPMGMDSHCRRMIGDDSCGLMGSIRPGCVHLSLDVWFSSQEEAEKGLLNFSDALVSMSSPEMPWSTFDTTVLLGDQCIKLKDGKVSNESPRSCPVRIVSAAPAGQETAALELSVVTEDNTELSDFELLLRLHGEFIELEVCEVQTSEAGVFSILARPIDGDIRWPSGMGWVEFANGAGVEEFSVSHAVPVFLSADFPSAALELATYWQLSPAAVSAANLQAIADILHPFEDVALDVAACAGLLRLTAMRGLHHVLEALIQAAEEFCLLHKVLIEADKGDIGLLSLAAVSGSVTTVSMVCDLLSDESLEADPCHLRSPMMMSALHWAALGGHEEVLECLAAEFPEVHNAMHSLQGGEGSVTMTPADVCLASKHGRFPRMEAKPFTEECCEGSAELSGETCSSQSGVRSSNFLSGLSVLRSGLPWLFLLFVPVALSEAKMLLDAVCAMVLALVADGIAQYSRWARCQYIQTTVMPRAVEAGIVSAEQESTAGMSSLLNQFENSRPRSCHSWSTLMNRLAGYWSLQLVGCVAALAKCSEGSRPFWLAWLGGTLLLSVLLVVASTCLETVGDQKYFNMAVLLTMQGLTVATIYAQPEAISPVFPPAESVMTVFESLTTCAIMGVIFGLWYCLAYGLAPLWTATACMVMDVYTIAKDFQDLHFGRALPFTGYLLLGAIRMTLFHTLWIRNERKLLVEFVAAQSKGRQPVN